MIRFEIGGHVVDFLNVGEVKEKLQRKRVIAEENVLDMEARREMLRVQIAETDYAPRELVLMQIFDFSETCKLITDFRVELETLDKHLENVRRLENIAERIRRDLGDVERDLARITDQASLEERLI